MTGLRGDSQRRGEQARPDKSRKFASPRAMGNAGSSEGTPPPSADGGLAGMSFGLENLELPWSQPAMPGAEEGGGEEQSAGRGASVGEQQSAGVSVSDRQSVGRSGSEASDVGAGSREEGAPGSVHSHDGSMHAEGGQEPAPAEVRPPPPREKPAAGSFPARFGASTGRSMMSVNSRGDGVGASRKKLELLAQLKKENERLLELKRHYALRIAGADPVHFLQMKEEASQLIPRLMQTPEGVLCEAQINKTMAIKLGDDPDSWGGSRGSVRRKRADSSTQNTPKSTVSQSVKDLLEEEGAGRGVSVFGVHARVQTRGRYIVLRCSTCAPVHL